MSHWPIVRIVDAPNLGARVLFDCNTSDGPMVANTSTYVGAEGFSLGAPQLMGSNGARGRVWANREIRLPLVVRGERGNTESVLSRLARALVREEVYLQVQLEEGRRWSWFTCWPGSQELDFSRVYGPDWAALWLCDVRLQADAFALGEEVVNEPVSVSNDPSAGGCTFMLPPAVGDAPAPLSLRVSTTETLGGDWRFMWSAAATLPDTDSTPVWLPPSSLAPGSGASALTPDASFPGGYYQLTPSSSQPTQTVAAEFLTVRPGRYLVLQRIGSAVTSPGYVEIDATIHEQLWMRRERLRFTSSDLVTWGVLGEVAHPRNVDLSTLSPSDVALGLQATARSQVIVTSGTVALRYGGLLLIPVDAPGFIEARTLFSRPGQVLADEVARWDGETQSIVRYDSAGRVYALSSPRPEGAWPRVHPGLDNRMFMVAKTNTFSPSPSDAPARTMQVTTSYRPRFLWFPSTATEVGE